MTGNADAATRLQRLRGFLQADPGNLRLVQDAAAVARDLRDLDAEREILGSGLAHHPEDAALGHTLGVNALERRDFRNAAICFDTLLAAGHEHPAIRYNLAFAQFYAGFPQAAIDALADFSDADWAQLPQAHKLFAQAAHYVDDEGLQRTILHLQKYLAVKDDDAEAHGLLALALFDDNLAEEAEQRIQATLQRRPDEPHALLAQGGLALERQDHRQAAESFDAVLRQQPQNGRAWSGRAFAHMLNLDFTPAQEAFLKAVEHMPDHIGTWHGLAWLRIMNNDLAGAQQSLDKAMALDRNFGDTHGSMAVIAALQGRTDEAKLMARRGRGLNPQSFSARYAESLLLARFGEREQASEVVRKLLASSVVEGGLSAGELTAALLERRQRDAAKAEGPHS
nr:tetratricopeptide repeat protein [Solimonas sp. SE-A11]